MARFDPHGEGRWDKGRIESAAKAEAKPDSVLYLEVGCPDCGALAGELCTTPLLGQPIEQAHLERTIAHRMSARSAPAPTGPGCHGCPYYGGMGHLCVCGIARGRMKGATS